MVSHCACPTRVFRDRALHEHRRPSSLPSHLSFSGRAFCEQGERLSDPPTTSYLLLGSHRPSPPDDLSPSIATSCAHKAICLHLLDHTGRPGITHP